MFNKKYFSQWTNGISPKFIRGSYSGRVQRKSAFKEHEQTTAAVG